MNPNWQTMWSIVGPKLFAETTRLNSSIVIAPIDHATSQQMNDLRLRGFQSSATTANYVVQYPPTVEIKSLHILQIDVFAEGDEEALAVAKTIADKITTSLSLSASGARYYAEFRKMRKVNQLEENNAWSETGTITPLAEADNLNEDESNDAVNIYELIDNNSTAYNAYVNLITAWQLLDTAGSKPLQSSILQHFILCVEAIVNGLMSDFKTKQGDSIRLAERNYANEFARTIDKRADKPAAIREAAKELTKLSKGHFTDKLDIVAQILGVDSVVAGLAKDFYRFRSAQLSHPGSKDFSKFKFWLQSGPTTIEMCKADMIARHFFQQYCRHISK